MSSWRLLNQQERPHVTHKPFPFQWEDIVEELLEGQKTGRATVETVCVFNPTEKVCMKGSDLMNENIHLKIFCLFDLLRVWINNYQQDYSR